MSEEDLLQKVLNLIKYCDFAEVSQDDYRDASIANPGFSISSTGWFDHHQNEGGSLQSLLDIEGSPIKKPPLDVLKIYNTAKPNRGVVEKYFETRDIVINVTSLALLQCRVKSTSYGHAVYTPMRSMNGDIQQLHVMKLNEDCEKIEKSKIYGQTKLGRCIRLAEKKNKKCMIVEGLEDGVILFQEFPHHDIIISVNHSNSSKVKNFLKPYNECRLILDHDDNDDAIKHSLRLGGLVERYRPLSKHVDANRAHQELCDLSGWYDTLEHLPLSHLAKEYDLSEISGQVQYVHRGKRGKILNTSKNLKSLLDHIDMTLKYDVISKTVEFNSPNAPNTTYDNSDNSHLTWIKSECNRLHMPDTNIIEYCSHIADQNDVNPIMTWIKSKPWGGADNIKQLCDTVKPNSFPNAFKETLITKWLLSAVYMAQNNEGISQSKGVLVFQGKQNVGKTRWFNRLLPKDLRKYSKESVVLDIKDKDSVLTAISHWLVELGELEGTFKKSDIAQLKAFISSTTDRLRRPYARVDSKYPRRTVFFASVNDTTFLRDETGNVRYWTIPVAHLNYDHDVDMQQVFAQCLAYLMDGQLHYLTDTETNMLGVTNMEFEELCPIQENILNAFKWKYVDHQIVKRSETYRNQWNASEVCQKLNIPFGSKRDINKVSTILKSILGPSVKSNGRRFWKLPDVQVNLN